MIIWVRLAVSYIRSTLSWTPVWQTASLTQEKLATAGESANIQALLGGRCIPLQALEVDAPREEPVDFQAPRGRFL